MTVERGSGAPDDPWFHVDVQLVGEDGNIFNLIGKVLGALKRAGASKDDQEQFVSFVTSSSSYDEALQQIMRWVCVS